MSGGPQFGLSVRLIFRARRGFRSSVAARVLFEMAAAAAVVSASSLLFAVRVRNRMRGDAAADTPSRSLLFSESIPIWRVARLPPPCVGWPADSVHSSLFPHCQCFKRRFLPSSLPVAAVQVQCRWRRRRWLLSSVCRWREKGERTTRNCEMRREGGRGAD